MTSEQPDDVSQSSSSNRLGILLAIPLLLVAGIALFLTGKSTTEQPSDDTETSSRLAQTQTGQSLPSGGFSKSQKHAIGEVVKDYLLDNPEILLDVRAALDLKLEKEQAEKTKAAIAENAKDIYRHPAAAVAGNPDGDITVVEFFDYNCGYCKRGFADIAKLIKQDPKVRFVFKEFPILSEDSEKAAKVALAARLQGKYWEVHQTLISNRGRATEQTALKAAEEAGVDMAKLKADLSTDAVVGELKRVQELAKTMGISGTPHFLIGDRSIGGAPQDLLDQLTGHIKELRTKGCSYC